MSPNLITEITRRDLFEAIEASGAKWSGRLEDADFLGRIFDLQRLPSFDTRHSDMAGDIWRHTVANPGDWPENWVFDEPRLNLRAGRDDVLLRFLCEMLHPVVRSDQDEVDGLFALFNRLLAPDGYHIAVTDYISGRRVFAAHRALPGVDLGLAGARKIAHDLDSGHMFAQITRMQNSIVSDPALAIGSAKDFAETTCKAVLAAQGVPMNGNEDLPKLAAMVRHALKMAPDDLADNALKGLSSALVAIVKSISDLRGQVGTGHGGAPGTAPPAPSVAKLAVSAATAYCAFVWERQRE